MYQKIKAKFKANPTIFYACSIVASWAGVGSLMNFRTLAINNGAAAAIIWAVFNSLACIFFGLFAEYIPTVRRIMQSKVMFYFIGFLTVFQTWTQMSGIYEIFGDTPIGTTGGTLIVYGTCLVFLFMHDENHGKEAVRAAQARPQHPPAFREAVDRVHPQH